MGIYPQEEVIDSEGNLRSGTCTFDPASRSAVIRIRESAEEDSRLIIKACHERVLVHELLHLTYNLTEPVDTIESIFYHEHEHELLEKMAKTLIMTKYDLDFDWFKNF